MYILPTKLAHEVIKTAGTTILQYYGKQLELQYKSTNADYRTQADLTAEKIIIQAID